MTQDIIYVLMGKNQLQSFWALQTKMTRSQLSEFNQIKSLSNELKVV